jgi:hypothetical protein
LMHWFGPAALCWACPANLRFWGNKIFPSISFRNARREVAVCGCRGMHASSQGSLCGEGSAIDGARHRRRAAGS